MPHTRPRAARAPPALPRNRTWRRTGARESPAARSRITRVDLEASLTLSSLQCHHRAMDGIWTITELAERAAAALAADGSAQVSGRVRDLPNERLIRWYTTIGLVDPPLGRRGRTALYGPRHLLQLVAVKRLQAAGHSIAEIQIELAAATDTTLERIAALPPRPAAAPAPAPLPGPDAVTEPAGEGRRHPSPSDDPSASTSEANRSPRQTPGPAKPPAPDFPPGRQTPPPPRQVPHRVGQRTSPPHREARQTRRNRLSRKAKPPAEPSGGRVPTCRTARRA